MACARCETKQDHAFKLWAGVALISTLLELVALKHHNHRHTLSHATRSVFRTHTRPGRLTFAFAWSILYIWLLDHVNRSPHNHR